MGCLCTISKSPSSKSRWEKYLSSNKTSSKKKKKKQKHRPWPAIWNLWIRWPKSMGQVSKIHGSGVQNPWVRCPKSMGQVSKIHGSGVQNPWVRCPKSMGQVSKIHGSGVQNLLHDGKDVNLYIYIFLFLSFYLFISIFFYFLLFLILFINFLLPQKNICFLQNKDTENLSFLFENYSIKMGIIRYYLLKNSTLKFCHQKYEYVTVRTSLIYIYIYAISFLTSLFNSVE